MWNILSLPGIALNSIFLLLHAARKIYVEMELAFEDTQSSPITSSTIVAEQSSLHFFILFGSNPKTTRPCLFDTLAATLVSYNFLLTSSAFGGFKIQTHNMPCPLNQPNPIS